MKLPAFLHVYLLRHVQVALNSLGRLYRAPLASLMTAGVIGIALALPAGLYLLTGNLQRLSTQWDGGANLSVFLHHTVSIKQAEALKNKLQAWPEIEKLQLITPQQARDLCLPPLLRALELDPFLPENENAKAHMQSMLTEIHQQFIDSVKKGRGDRLDTTVDGLFSGLIWTGETAVNIGLVDVAVPDIIGVDHQHRALAATVQAAGGIDTHLALTGDTQLFTALLGVVAHRLGVEALTTGRAVSAQIGAEEDVIFIVRHTVLPLKI